MSEVATPRSPDARRIEDDDETGPSVMDLLLPVVRRWKLVLAAAIAAGLAAIAASYAVQPIFTAHTRLLPPQQQQTSNLAALASLGALAGLAGAAGVRTPADQYVGLLQSDAVRDRIIKALDLQTHYESKYLFEARKELDRRVRIAVGKKDGLITIESEDESPERAAAIANLHVTELRRLTSELALTEAQQRRNFFEDQVKKTRNLLVKAQAALEGSGFNPGALRTDPRAAAESYARLKAEVMAAEIRLQSLRRTLTDSAPEVQQQQSVYSSLRAELSKAETVAAGSNAAAPATESYIGKYREFKYQEALFDLFSRQFELAKLDESKEGTLIQVIDPALRPEYKSRPRRAMWAVVATVVTGLMMCLALAARAYRHWIVSRSGGSNGQPAARRDPESGASAARQ